jgi:predicted O-methyltransferase YrrM
MSNNILNIPRESPSRIFALRESSFACDLFITAVSHFDFFNWLDKSPSDIDTICKSLKLKKRPADVMLTLFKAYGLIKEKNKKYCLTDISRHYLVQSSDFDLTSYVSSLKDRPICEDMKKVLLTGKPANWAAAKAGKEWARSMEDEKFAAPYSAGMNSRGAYLASGVVKAIDLKGYKNLLDIGGASGIYTAFLVVAYPQLKATIFEKSPVDKVAQYTVNKFNLNKQIKVITGDFFKHQLPRGHDIHFLSHVLHDWDIDKVRAILKNSYDNLDKGGIIIVHSAHINRKKTGPVSIAEYSVLLMFLSEGKCYSITEMQDIMEETGFKAIEYRPTILNRSIIIGKK